MCGHNPLESCPVCEERDPAGYWCEICGQVVTDKRCSLCGLKTRKMRMEGGEKKGKK
jgi:predicted RNA-binding protein with PUA domain